MVQKRLTTASVYSLPDIGDGVYRQKRIGVVVPAFNEERFIADVIETIPSFVDEIVIVDDGSTDATGPTAAKYVEKDKDRISLLRHEKRSGVGSAIVSGYKAALGKQLDIVAVMAGDGQMDPKHLPRLLDPIVENKADYSKGNRLLSAELEQMPRRRIRGNAILTLLTKVASGYYDVMDPQNGYTAISRRALESLDLERVFSGYGYCNDILIQLNENNFTVVDVVMPPRYRGEESYIKLGRYSARLSWLLLRGFFRRIFRKYSRPRTHPILLFYLSSFGLLITGAILGLVVILDRIVFGAYSVGTVLLTALLLILGTQSLCFATFFDGMKSGYHRSIGQMKETATSVGFFRRLRYQYLGINFHPLGLFYLVAVALLVLGSLLGVFILYSRITTGGFSLGTITLDFLVIVVGVQFLFFAMLFEAERERFLK